MRITQDRTVRTVVVDLDEPAVLHLPEDHPRAGERLAATSVEVEFRDGSFQHATIRVRAVLRNGALGRFTRAIVAVKPTGSETPQVIADALDFIRNQED